MDSRILSNITVTVNNTAIAYVPGSLKYNEGMGEQKMHPQAGGGGAVQIAYSDDVNTHIGKVSFELLPTNANIALARVWKNNGNANVIRLSMSGSDFLKTFGNAAMTNSYEVNLSADGKLACEFQGNPAV
jgi:hypothetical protein